MKRRATKQPVWADVVQGGSLALVVTCEHAGNVVPKPFAALMRGRRGLLSTHRGFDPGALQLATALAENLDAPLFVQPVTRLLIDCNRSLTSRDLVAPWNAGIDDATRRALVERIYLPYRRAAETQIAQAIESGARVVHLSAHSFTPVLKGVRRSTDLGILFDPARGPEAALATALTHGLRAAFPHLVIAHNAPYAGTDDGFTSSLRNRFAAHEYLGLELEVNQRLVRRRTLDVHAVADAIEHAVGREVKRAPAPARRGQRSRRPPRS